MYGAGGLATPTLQNQEWNEWDKKSSVSPGPVPYSNPSKEQRDAERRRRGTHQPYASLVALARLAMHLAHSSFKLQHIGRMKRPDIRLSWREKMTIFRLIFILNAVVNFYIIIEFGYLLCPNFVKPGPRTR